MCLVVDQLYHPEGVLNVDVQQFYYYWLETCGSCHKDFHFMLVNWGVIDGKGVCDTCCNILVGAKKGSVTPAVTI